MKFFVYVITALVVIVTFFVMNPNIFKSLKLGVHLPGREEVVTSSSPAVSTEEEEAIVDQSNNIPPPLPVKPKNVKPEEKVPAQPVSPIMEEPPSQEQPQEEEITPPQGFTKAQLSPYYQKISISYLKPAYSFEDTSQFVLTAGEYEGLINVTGWKIKTNKGQLFIPPAVNVYYPDRTPAEGNILLKAGEYLVVYNTKSPLGRNFRLNKCTGFFNSEFNFEQGLPNECPALYNQNDIVTFSGKCQSFIMSLGSCQAPTADEINSMTSEGTDCRAYLNRFNYSFCFNQHYLDSDFLSREWRVWLNTSMPFDPQHDRVLLFDLQGLLVNEYIY